VKDTFSIYRVGSTHFVFEYYNYMLYIA